MIWVIVFGFIVILVGAALIWMINTGHRFHDALTCLMIIVGVVAFVMLVNAGITQLDTDTTNERNLACYEELMLYRDIVQDSDDELLRWDYYSKVQTWNDRYENYLEGRTSMWRSAYFGSRDYDNCDFISFELKRN